MSLSPETLVKEHVNETQQLSRKHLVITVDLLLNGVLKHYLNTSIKFLKVRHFPVGTIDQYLMKLIILL